MYTLSVLALAATALAVPHWPVRSTFSVPSVTETFVLPPPPVETGTIWAEETEKRSANEEAQRLAEEVAAEKRGTLDSWGTSPNSSQVQITGMTYAGTGCPANSAAYALSSDLTTMTVLMSDYVASIGAGVAITESRKNCQLNLQLHYPSGFQYSIFSADYRGYAYLDPGVTGQQSSTYYFSGQTAQVNTGTTWKGPYTGDYLISDQAQSASIVWSPCGQAALLNINSAISLTSTNKTGQGLLTTDSIDTSFQTTMHIAWQTCTGS